MQLASEAQIPDGVLAARVLLNEKPRLGFRASESTVHQGLDAAKYLNHVGVATTVVRYTWQMSLKAQQQGASSTSQGMTTTITHADGTVEVRHGTAAFRDNNPGNIAPGGFAKANGQIGVDPGTKGISGPFAVFENTASGQAALSSMLGTPQVGARTIIAEMSRYASSKTGNPVAYAHSISRALGGIDVTTRISALSSAQRAIIVQQIMQTEGSSGTVRFVQP